MDVCVLGEEEGRAIVRACLPGKRAPSCTLKSSLVGLTEFNI